MTIEHMREFGTGAAMRPRPAAPAGLAQAFAGLLRRVRTLMLVRRANRLLKRATRRPQHLYLDEMPAYLRRDLGLPPDFR